jgi:DNA polymerase-1
MPVCGIDTESDGPLLFDKWVKRKKGMKRKYRNFINMYKSTTVGFSLAFPDRTAYYVPLAHRVHNAPYQLALEVLRAAVSPERTGWIHNLKHELHAFQRLGLRLQPWESGCRDSLVAAWLACEPGNLGLKELCVRHLGLSIPDFETVTGGNPFGLLDPESDEATYYACCDAVGSLLLGERYKWIIANWGLVEWFDREETVFTYALAEMSSTGIVVDTPGLLGLHDECLTETTRLAEEFLRLTGASVSSSAQLQTLFESGMWPSEWQEEGRYGLYTKQARKTPKGSYKTDALSMKQLLPHMSEEGKRAYDLRLAFQAANKIRSTYSKNLVEIADEYPDGRLHPDFKQAGTETGRISSTRPNATNMPVRSDIGKRLLQCLVVAPGRRLLSCDYSQIELRVLAHFAGGRLADGYRRGADVHAETGQLLGITRNQGKTANFANVYGAGPRKLREDLGIEDVDDFIKRYAKAYPRLRPTFERIHRAAYRRGYVRTLSGRRRLFPAMVDRDPGLIRRGFSAVRSGDLDIEELLNAWRDERAAGNTVCQGGAADIMKKAVVDLYMKGERPGGLLLNNFIHDDIRCEVDEFHEEEALDYIREVMESAWPELRVPLKVDGICGDNWCELK